MCEGWLRSVFRMLASGIVCVSGTGYGNGDLERQMHCAVLVQGIQKKVNELRQASSQQTVNSLGYAFYSASSSIYDWFNKRLVDLTTTCQTYLTRFQSAQVMDVPFKAYEGKAVSGSSSMDMVIHSDELSYLYIYRQLMVFRTEALLDRQTFERLLAQAHSETEKEAVKRLYSEYGRVREEKDYTVYLRQSHVDYFEDQMRFLLFLINEDTAK